MAHGKHPQRWLSTRFRVLALCLSTLLLGEGATASTAGTPPFTGVSLRIPTSSAPPGGVIQLIVTLTEPTPIMAGVTSLSWDPGAALGSVLGVALFGPQGSSSEVAGTAVVRDNQLTIRTTSPSAEFGTTPGGAAIVSVTVGVPSDALGAKGTVALDLASSLWLDPSGEPYPQQVKNGTFEILGEMSISDVLPGHGVLPAGSIVTVRGMGFQPGALVDIDDVAVASTAFVSDTELQATIAEPADMYGRKVKVKNPDLALASYYAYPRTASLARSARPLLAATDPIFSPKMLSGASFTNSAAGGQFLALALQNPSGESATVTVELHSAAGDVLASSTLDLPADSRISREVSELFAGTTAPTDGSLVVRSSAPVQMLGLIGDDAAGSVVPLTPVVTLP